MSSQNTNANMNNIDANTDFNYNPMAGPYPQLSFQPQTTSSPQYPYLTQAAYSFDPAQDYAAYPSNVATNSYTSSPGYIAAEATAFGIDPKMFEFNSELDTAVNQVQQSFVRRHDATTREKILQYAHIISAVVSRIEIEGVDVVVSIASVDGMLTVLWNTRFSN